MGRTWLGAKFKRPYLCEIESYGSEIWQAMTSLSVVLSDSQARPFPKCLRPVQPVNLCQYEPAVSLSDEYLQI